MSKSEGKKTKALFIDFDGTLTAEHTGGAVFIDLNDGDRCWRPGLGEGALSSNVASGEAGWTFRLLYDLVMTQKVCVAIVTMADEKHGDALRRWLHIHPKERSRWAVLAGRELVLQWLGCAARQTSCAHDDSERLVAEMLESNRFFIDAHFHATSKAAHVRNSLGYFLQKGSLARETLRNDNLLMIDDTFSILSDIVEHFSGIDVEFVGSLGLCRQTFAQMLDHRSFLPSVVHPCENDIDKDENKQT